MPELSICLVSDRELNAGEDIFIKHDDKDIGGRIAKLKMDELAPARWRYVLYMDADVELLEDVSFYFKLLEDGWEFVICKDMNKYSTIGMMHRPDNIDECNITWDAVGTKEAMQYNGGMMAFARNENTKRFFELWQSEWDRFGKRDQGALIRALYMNPLRMFVLMNQWNASDRYPMPPGKVAVLHHNVTARRWTGRIAGRIDSDEAWSAVNKWERQRPKESE
jgi:lipopolysaccharide biosynthesis glycosyltransferase